MLRDCEDFAIKWPLGMNLGFGLGIDVVDVSLRITN